MSVYFLSIPPKKLSRSITSASTSFRLNNIKSWKRNSLGVTINLAQSDFGTRAFGCFRNETGSKIEIFEFDPSTIASTDITILKRGLDFNGDMDTQTSAYKLDWSANETTVQLGTDVPQLFQYLKEYIDDAVIGGGVPASTTTLGLTEEATSAETVAGTAAGSLGRLFVNPANLAAWLNDRITIETTTGVTHSLTTVADQKVLVFAKGNVYADGGSSTVSITLKYNGVTKDTVATRSISSSNSDAFMLMYTETPGAGTHDITVENSAQSMENVVIIVVKIKT